MKEDERELVRRTLDGDHAAFGRLMAQLDPDLKSFLRGKLRGNPEISVEDVLQEVRIYFFQRLDRYDPAYPVGVFARALAKNIAKRFLYGKRDLLPADPTEESSDAGELSPLELGELPLTFRQVMGEGRFSNPDGPPPPSRTFLELFAVFLRYGGYPHQQVAFGYSILLWGKEKRRAGPLRASGSASESPARRVMPSEKVPVTGDPERVVREVGPRELQESSGELLGEVGCACHLEAGYLNRVRLPLTQRLSMTVAELFARDRASFDRFRALGDREVARTELGEYFGTDPRKSVSDWTHAVKERVKRTFLDPASRSRVPLPEFTGAPREV
jgi:hypothetical protein